LAQIILWRNDSKFVEITGIAPLQGMVIAKKSRNTLKFFRSSSPEPTGQNQLNGPKLSFGEGNSSLFK
jgi:hypothetical protein